MKNTHIDQELESLFYSNYLYHKVMTQIHEPKSLNAKRPAVEENLEEEVVEKKIKVDVVPEVQPKPQAIQEEVQPKPQVIQEEVQQPEVQSEVQAQAPIEEEVPPAPQNSEPAAPAE